MSGRGIGIWTLCSVFSVAIHAGGLVALALSVAPEAVDSQSTPASKLTIQSQKVDRVTAKERPAASDLADEGNAQGTRIGQGAIRKSKAKAANLKAAKVLANVVETPSIAPLKSRSEVAPSKLVIGDNAVVAALPKIKVQGSKPDSETSVTSQCRKRK